MVDLPEHDETAACRYEWTGVELVGPDEALSQFPSENIEPIATSISQDHVLPKSRTDHPAERSPADDHAATARTVTRRGSVLLVSASSFVFGVAAGAAIVWLSGPSASRLTTVGAAASQPLTTARRTDPVQTPALPAAAFAVVRPHQRVPNRSPASPPPRSARLTAFRGSLTVSSRPSGAYVFLNGRRAGTTPLVLANQPVGSRAVRIELDGYDAWTSAVQVVTNTSTSVRADLKPTRVSSNVEPREGPRMN